MTSSQTFGTATPFSRGWPFRDGVAATDVGGQDAVHQYETVVDYGQHIRIDKMIDCNLPIATAFKHTRCAAGRTELNHVLGATNGLDTVASSTCRNFSAGDLARARVLNGFSPTSIVCPVSTADRPPRSGAKVLGGIINKAPQGLQS